MEVEHLVKEGLSHRKSIMAKLDAYGDDYRSVPVLIPSEAEAASAVRATQPSITSTHGGLKKFRPSLDNAFFIDFPLFSPRFKSKMIPSLTFKTRKFY